MAGEDGAPKRKTSLPASRLQLAACAAATFGAAGAYWFLVASLIQIPPSNLGKIGFKLLQPLLDHDFLQRSVIGGSGIIVFRAFRSLISEHVNMDSATMLLRIWAALLPSKVDLRCKIRVVTGRVSFIWLRRIMSSNISNHIRHSAGTESKK